MNSVACFTYIIDFPDLKIGLLMLYTYNRLVGGTNACPHDSPYPHAII